MRGSGCWLDPLGQSAGCNVTRLISGKTLAATPCRLRKRRMVKDSGLPERQTGKARLHGAKQRGRASGGGDRSRRARTTRRSRRLRRARHGRLSRPVRDRPADPPRRVRRRTPSRTRSSAPGATRSGPARPKPLHAAPSAAGPRLRRPGQRERRRRRSLPSTWTRPRPPTTWLDSPTVTSSSELPRAEPRAPRGARPRPLRRHVGSGGGAVTRSTRGPSTRDCTTGPARCARDPRAVGFSATRPYRRARR